MGHLRSIIVVHVVFVIYPVVFPDNNGLVGAFPVKIVQVLVVETNDRFTHAEVFGEMLFRLFGEVVLAIRLKRQNGFGCGLDDTSQRLELERFRPLLDDGHEQQHHQYGEQQPIIFHLESPHAQMLEPEVDERAEVTGIQGGHAEHKGAGGNDPDDDVGSVFILGEVNLLL